MRHRQGEGLRKLSYDAQEAVFSILLSEDMFLRQRQQAQPLLRRTRRPFRPVEAMEQSAADLVLLQHQGDGLVLIKRRPPPSAAFGAGRERLFQLMARPS
jgi:hypothetical protein